MATIPVAPIAIAENAYRFTLQAIIYKDKYLNNIKQVLSGDTPKQLDTAAINLPKPDISDD